MIELVELALGFLSELITGIVEQFSRLAVLAMIGFCYLHVRYHNRLLIARILIRRYENSYANAGLDAALKLLAASGIILVLGLLSSTFWH